MNFTVDWFSNHVALWEEMVVPKLRAAVEPEYLEIGSYEGRSLLWMLAKVPLLTATSIDPHTDGSWERFNENVGNKAIIHKERSNKVLPTLTDSYDLIYIDGSHYAADVLFDSVLAWPRLKQGGLLVWDDYGWILDEEERLRPKFAIDAFLVCYRTQYKVLHIGYQVIVEKL